MTKGSNFKKLKNITSYYDSDIYNKKKNVHTSISIHLDTQKKKKKWKE